MTRSNQLGTCRELVLEAGTLRYYECGSGRPIVFIHGVLVNANLWRKVIPALSQGFRCIAPDLPLGSHEAAMKPEADLSPPAVARLIAEFLERLELQDVTLVGNNTGGALCQILVANHPQRIGRLVLLPADAYDNFLPPVFRYLQWSARIPGMIFLLMQLMRVRLLRRLPIAYGWVEKRPIEPEVSDSYVQPALSSAAVRRDLIKVLQGISTKYTLTAAQKFGEFRQPVLIAWATEDRSFPLKHGEKLAAAFPNARLERIEDSYTFVAEDQPERLIELLRAF